MKKEYKLTTYRRAARPRSKRIKNAGGGSGGGSSVVVTIGGGDTPAPDPNSHTHNNKHALDQIDVEEGYIYLNSEHQELDPITGEVLTVKTREKVKAGVADRAIESDHALEADHAVEADHSLEADHATEADHAASAHDVDDDSPAYDRFLRKDVDDTANNTIIFEKQQEFKNGVRFGAGGKGGHIDGNGNGVLKSLRLKDFLEVPELRYNSTEVQLGIVWNAPGGGVIERCVPDVDAQGNALPSGTIYLKLSDKQRGAVSVDDFCMGIFHDEANLGNNATQDSDDGRGNFKISGFFTAYFRVTEILDKNMYSSFRYQLRSRSARWQHQFHPAAAMNFVAYGNKTKPERQTSRYSTRSYERYLINVIDWEITRENVAAQFGELDNLSIFGLNMDGYSAFLDNIYMSGTIQQFEDAGYHSWIELSNGEYLGEGESKNVKVIINNGYGRDVSENFQLLTLTRNSGNSAADNQWNQTFATSHPNGFPNPFTLSYSDMGFDDNITQSVNFTYTAQDLNTGKVLTNNT